MRQHSRRTFLKTSTLAAGALAFSARSWGQVMGANGDIRVAVIGLNGRGQNHVASLSAIKGVRIVALCDPDTTVLARAKDSTASMPHRSRPSPTRVNSFGSAEIDAVTIATPNHWHSLAGIWACQAGKDVYVEKPVSHNVWEGRQLAIAAKKYDRIVQAGTQIRSGEGLREAVAWVRAGNLGKITVSRGLCYKRRDSIGKTTGPQPIPASINYDLWTGPAPLLPRGGNSKKNGPVHYEWHWFLELWLQWRCRQPGHSSDGCRPLVSRRDLASPATASVSVAGSVTMTTAKRPAPRSSLTIIPLRP